MMPTKIQIVEDEAIIAMDLSSRLRGFGYEVTGIAATSDQAIKLFERSPPDLILMDIMIRGSKDGIETVEMLNDRFRVPVIYITAYSDENTLNRAKETKPYGYLIKPFRPEDTRITIEFAIYKHRVEFQLQQHEHWFSNTLRCINDGIITTDISGTIRYINPIASKFMGMDYDQTIGQTLDTVLTLLNEADKTQLVPDPIKTCLAQSEVLEEKKIALLPSFSGELRVIEYNAAPMFGGAGELMGAVLVIRDITVHRIAELALRESEERFHSAFDFAVFGMILASLEGHLLQINKAITSILGYVYSDLDKLHLEQLCHTEDYEALNLQLQELLTHKIPRFQTELRFITKLHRVIWVLFSASLVCDSNGQPINFILQLLDVTDRLETAQHLTYLATHDVLTGLFNRTQVVRKLDQLVSIYYRRNALIAVLFVDLDNFKLINDSLGHEAGDEVLREVANRLTSTVRERSDIVGRYGGDEFIVVLTQLEQIESIILVADKLVSSITDPILIHGCEIQMTTSIGIALFPRDADTSERLIVAADDAMYRAKELGKNGFAFYSTQWSQKITYRMQMESELRQAISLRQFELYYQPICTTEGEIISFEALLRWHHSERGLVPPDEFIPLAERTGLIVPIGHWIIAEACQQIRVWQAKYTQDFSVAINMSARQFRDPRLMEIIQQELNATDLPPKSLVLELTESSIMQQPERASLILQELRNLGLKISVDDFGTGYSSLSYLKRLPINTLKIDRSFMTDLPGNRESEAIVNAIITLSQTLDLKIIVEGVENESQLEYLRSLKQQFDNEHSIFIQGYCFYRPCTADTVNGLLAQRA